MSHTVTLMKNPSCGPCIATNRAFESKLKASEQGIETVDLSQDVEAHELAITLGHRSAPVVVVRDSDGIIVDHWAGLRLDKVDQWSKTLITEQSRVRELVAG